MDYLTWSRSGEYIHFFDLAEDGTPFYRVRVRDHKLERIGVVNLSRGVVKGQFGQWTGLAPDDSPLLLHDSCHPEPNPVAQRYIRSPRLRAAGR
jgi:hypothetical protein